MRLIEVLLAIALVCASSLADDGKPPQPIDADLAGVKSRYTPILLQMAKDFLGKPQVMDPAMAGPVPLPTVSALPHDFGVLQVRCWETPGLPLYMGVEQKMVVRAPFESVVGVLDDFSHYQQLFPGYDDVHVLSRDGNILETFWEQHVPIIFVPNVKYEMTYLIDSSVPKRRVYRYILRKRSQLTASDGIILVEAASPTTTTYQEFDFFNADWGIAKAMGNEKLWHDSVEGIYLSDLSLKLKAENRMWPAEDALKEARKEMDRNEVKNCYKNRKAWASN